MKKINSILLICLVIANTLSLSSCKTENSEETTQVIEIQGTESLVKHVTYECVYLDKYFIITNPPKDLYDLKSFVDDYITSIEESLYEIEYDNEIIHYSLVFHRESNKTPSDWSEKENIDFDMLNRHSYDRIAVVNWKGYDGRKNYILWEKSSDRKTYGNYIKQITFLEDEVEEITTYDEDGLMESYELFD